MRKKLELYNTHAIAIIIPIVRIAERMYRERYPWIALYFKCRNSNRFEYRIIPDWTIERGGFQEDRSSLAGCTNLRNRAQWRRPIWPMSHSRLSWTKRSGQGTKSVIYRLLTYGSIWGMWQNGLPGDHCVERISSLLKTTNWGYNSISTQLGATCNGITNATWSALRARVNQGSMMSCRNINQQQHNGWKIEAHQ